MKSETNIHEKVNLEKYLSPLAVWALSLGCAVGWGSFVMPGTTFLPAAGPLGTCLGIIAGAIVMFIIGVNYSYLMNKFPDAGGTLTYTIRTMGYDHGFMSSWFLILVYIAIIWANATGLGLISKSLFGDTFQFGFYYQVLGYDVYFGEVLLSIIAILICVILCIYSKRIAVYIQIIMCFVLVGGVVFCYLFALKDNGFVLSNQPNLFADKDQNPLLQISVIAALSPWAFAGFESVSNSAAGFKFNTKKVLPIIAFSLVIGAAVYILLAFLGASYTPDGYGNWRDYISNLDAHDGLEGIPVFFAANRVLGRFGVALLAFAALSGIGTGLIGNLIAASRLIYTMAKENILPKWFGELNKDHAPQNALLFLMGISLVAPFFGRTLIGWIIDVNTVGAAIAYAYTSAAAVIEAKKENNKRIITTGIVGFIFSVVFFMYFMSWSANAMATESYLILVAWGILGFVYFRIVFSHDTEKKFGKTIFVWIMLLFVIFYTTLMWVKQSTDDITTDLADNISVYYESKTLDVDEDIRIETESYLRAQLLEADRKITRNNIIQMILLMFSLVIMFSVYNLMANREKEIEAERAKAVAQTKAKSIFLSNMSHDIRTPMNAIIGYLNLAEREDISIDELKEYIEKIKGSSHHLLALINDVLEMSRIESGKIDLEPIPMDIKRTMSEVKDMFFTQMQQKDIEYTVDASGIRDSFVYCDKNRLNRVLLNLISNAYKFTPQGGSIQVSAWQLASNDKEYGRYELRVKDSGMGMSPEFAAKIFDAFERERTASVDGIEGTGLGMTITKNIVDLMGGEITVNTAIGMGTEFVVVLSFKLQTKEDIEKYKQQIEENNKKNTPDKVDFKGKRILLTDDVLVNREIAAKLLSKMGFIVEQAENGKVAAEKVASSGAGYYDLVLMDIQMPVMGGYEATALIRKLDNKGLASIPIIAMTANAFSEDVKKALDVGMNAHIAKPIDIPTMKKTIEEVLLQHYN